MRRCFDGIKLNKERIIMTKIVVNDSRLKRGHICLAVIFLSLLAVSMLWVGQKPTTENVPQQVVEPPDDIIFALANLEGNVGSAMEQRGDIYKISEALRIGVVSSSFLNKKGNWLTEFRRRVDVREAIEAFEELKTLETKASIIKLSRHELANLPLLRRLVEAQIYSQYAKEEGLTCSHAEVGNLLSQITKK
jgi:hypothetical protein